MNRRRHEIALSLLLTGAAAAAFAGCGVGDAADPSLPSSLAPTPGKVITTTTTETPVVEDCLEPACQTFPLAASPHAIRLTSAQWERTLRDLLRLPALPGNSVDFPPDPVSSSDHFGSEAGDLIVTTQHWAAYQKAAESLAALIAEDPVALDRLLPAAARTGETGARLAAFVADFLPRAYRRAVTPAEAQAVVSVGELAASNVSAGDPFAVRVKWILTAVLQSPKLVYRISFGEGEVKDKRVRLSAHEIASKLSYGLWGTMPDETLIAHARAGKLSTKEGVAEVARAMLIDPRAETALLDFHDELYLVNHFTEVQSRPSSTFPRFYPELPRDAKEDVRRTVRELVVQNNGGVKELDTSTVAFVNKRLAPIYGMNPSAIPELAAAGPEVFAKVQMDGTQRKGVLMHPGWLTFQGSPRDPSPIRRGAFVARHVLCTPLGSPPAGAAGADPDSKPEPTNRKRVEATTAACGVGCHSGPGGVINPLGFSFEGFDSIGQLRTRDGDFPVDTTGAVDVVGAFSGAVELFDAVSTNVRAHACYAAHWSAYLNGTSIVDVTPKWLSPAVSRSLANGSVRDIIVELVQTDAFLTVSR